MFYQIFEDAPFIRYISDETFHLLNSNKQDEWFYWDGTVIDPGNHDLYKFDKTLKWDGSAQKYTVRDESNKRDDSSISHEFIPNPNNPRHYDSSVNGYVSDDYHNSDEFAMYGEKRS